MLRLLNSPARYRCSPKWTSLFSTYHALNETLAWRQSRFSYSKWLECKMEIDDGNVAEIEKYAFLLGSALKNEDLEQFFSIYDSILPKSLPDNQLELIKSKAREVADLPDCDFNNLVFRARTFSLVPSGSGMSFCKPKSKWALSSQGEASEEDDEGIGSHRHYSGDSGNVCNSATKISSRSSESEFRNDSVVGNSSLATNSVDSISDDNADDDERTGTFDYFPQVKIRHGCGITMDYDEAHEVKSDHSSTDINSPRSDISDGIELTTFNSGHRVNEDTDDDFNFTRDPVRYQDDFNTDGDSDNEDSYQKRYYNMGYRPLEREGPKLQSLSFNSMNGERTSGLRGNEAVDKGISFPSLSGYSRHSEPVKIEKNSYSKRDPPFGRGLEQIQNVGSSVDKLIRDRPIHDVKDMPEGRKLELLQPEESKKKKKKRKQQKMMVR